MKRGAYIVNTARGKICDRDAIVAGAGERPARRLCRRCVVPAAGAEGPSVAHHAASRHDPAYLRHVALRAGPLCRGHARDPRMLFRRRPIRRSISIVDKGKLAGAGAHSYSAGNATKGSEEAAKFKKTGKG